jgi:phosphomethylpyrimidine synthase
MTQLACAKNNRLTALMQAVSSQEQLTPQVLLRRIRQGRVVIPANKKRKLAKPCGIGYGLRTKVNANLGTSGKKRQLKYELRKLRAAVDSGADTVMDLSVGADLKEVRREILRHSPVPVGTVPLYETAVQAKNKTGHLLNFDFRQALDTLKAQAAEGVDFFTIHAGVTRKSIAALEGNKRALGVVSRGGAILVNWIRYHKEENPFYQYFDQVLEIAYDYDVTLSLGDGLRPGSVIDATDRLQLAELKVLGELAERARQKGVQVIIEGPGHLPLDEIRRNVELEKKTCHHLPFYVLGPLVTDVAAGYDHISGAIGGALAASCGADFLCYVTASEHLRHPSVGDVREAVIASRIAAHAADLVKLKKQALSWDSQMTLARRQRNWSRQIKLSIDPKKAQEYRQSSRPLVSDVCTMCGDYCSLKLMDSCFVNRH